MRITLREWIFSITAILLLSTLGMPASDAQILDATAIDAQTSFGAPPVEPMPLMPNNLENDPGANIQFPAGGTEIGPEETIAELECKKLPGAVIPPIVAGQYGAVDVVCRVRSKVEVISIIPIRSCKHYRAGEVDPDAEVSPDREPPRFEVDTWVTECNGLCRLTLGEVVQPGDPDYLAAGGEPYCKQPNLHYVAGCRGVTLANSQTSEGGWHGTVIQKFQSKEKCEESKTCTLTSSTARVQCLIGMLGNGYKNSGWDDTGVGYSWITHPKGHCCAPAGK